jgi:uncharacterized protein YcfJ
MKKLSSIVLALTLATAVSGCTTTEQGATAGAVGGALIGQAIGRDTGSTLIGAGIGAVAGGLIGHSMEHRGYCRYQRRNGTIYEARC